MKSETTTHTNAISKIAVGKHDWPMVALVQEMDPIQALEAVEALMRKTAEYKEWERITPANEERKQSDGRIGYFHYWCVGANDFYRTVSGANPAVSVSNRLLGLIDGMAMIIGQKFFGSEIRFDDYVLGIMMNKLLEDLYALRGTEEGHLLLKRILSLTTKKIKDETKIFNPSIIISAFSQTIPHDNFKKLDFVLWLFEGLEKSGIPITRTSVTGRIAKILWFGLSCCTETELAHWVKIIGPAVPFLMNETVAGACMRAVEKIVAFQNQMDYLTAFIESLGLPILKNPGKVYDLQSLTLHNVTVTLDPNHPAFSKLLAREDAHSIVNDCWARLEHELIAWGKRQSLPKFKIHLVGQLMLMAPIAVEPPTFNITRSGIS